MLCEDASSPICIFDEQTNFTEEEYSKMVEANKPYLVESRPDLIMANCNRPSQCQPHVNLPHYSFVSPMFTTLYGDLCTSLAEPLARAHGVAQLWRHFSE